MTENREPGEIADAVADGLDIDWDAALAGAPPDQLPLLQQLRVLSSISRALGFPPTPDSVDATRHWGPFDIVEELDRGSYGRVFRAHDTRVDRDVAVKLLPGPARDDESGIDEARALGRVRHPNVVTVYGADRFDGMPGLWTEFIEGKTLQQLVVEHGTLGAREAALIGIDLCAALSAVHSAGLVHRDVTARNVMREHGGRIVLLDFGGVQSDPVAPGSHDARVAGTPLYMAPELFEGAAASPQSDLYALGVLLFLLVTGRFPVTGQTAADIRDAHRAGTRLQALDVRPDLSSALAHVIDRALSHDPANRYASAGEMRRALVRALDVGAETTGFVAARQARTGLPTWLVATLLVAAAAAGAAATAALLWHRIQPPGDEYEATQLSDEQWSVVESYYDLADSAATRGDWLAAATAYDRAGEVFAAAFGPQSSPAAIEKARAAYVRQQSGEVEFAAIEREYARALYSIAERAGAKQPIRSAIETARALNFWRHGDFLDASQALLRAIEIRERLFFTGGLAAAAIPARGLSEEALARHLETTSPAIDTDGDWLPDVIELAAGLDPARRDSDLDGLPDDEEDTDNDAVANGLEWAVRSNPANSFGFEGTTSPSLLGARWHGRGAQGRAAPSPDRAWRISGPLVSLYAHPMSNTKKAEAAARGWRLFLRARATRGAAVAGIDLLPHGRAYAINPVASSGGKVVVRLPRHQSPRGALVFELPETSRDSLLELTYDPAVPELVFRIDGRRVSTGYEGLTGNQMGWGAAWGSANDMGSAPAGEADFRLVFVEIR